MDPILAMAVHDTDDNGRTELTRRTLRSLSRTVDLSRFTLWVVNNASCDATLRAFDEFVASDPQGPLVRFLHNPANAGTAGAVNRAVARRQPGQGVVKIDNDVEWAHPGWVELLAEAEAREAKLGVIGLKRKDLAQTANATPGEWLHAPLYELPHQPGQPWLYLQATHDVMGTCVLYTGRLLDRVGFLSQPAEYGFDDCLMCLRAAKAGFLSGFVLSTPWIDHIDPGGTDYSRWKEAEAHRLWGRYEELAAQYRDGSRNVYEPFTDPTLA